MASILDERFETATTGYEETWDALVTNGGSSFSPIQAPPAGNPTTWQTQCGRFITVASQDCYLARVPTAAPLTFTVGDFIYTSESLADNEQCGMFFALDGGLANFLWLVRLIQVGGVVSSELLVAANGTLGSLDIRPWSLNVMRRFEVNWNNTANTYQAWVDGTSVGSGSLSGSAAAWDLGAIVLGTFASTVNNPVTFYADLVRADNAVRASLDGVGGGAYHQQAYRSLITD